MSKKAIRKNSGIQTDIYGNPVHILNTNEIYRMVKCGKCGETVKLSQARLHLSFGNKLNICSECLEKIDNKKRVFDTKTDTKIIDLSKIGGMIESEKLITV